MWPFGGSEKPNPITDLDKDAGKLVCEECGVEPLSLYDTGDWLMCQECADAEMRRQRFKEEDEEWNKLTTPGGQK